MHTDGEETNALVLTADGQAALGRGDYANAMVYFQKAMAADPRSSEARVGYAQALLQVKGFDLASFIKHLMTDSEGPVGTTPLVDPADWGCADNAELINLFTTLINTLDPIAQGATTGRYQHNDVTVNLDAGFLFILRVAARSQNQLADYTMVQFSKSTVTAADLGLSPAEFAAIYPQLPDTFWWIANTPSMALLTQLQTDTDSGVARLRTAATVSGSQLISDLVDQFASIQLQVHP
jgi:hypothetical protein